MTKITITTYDKPLIDQSYNYQPEMNKIDGKDVVVGGILETSHNLILHPPGLPPRSIEDPLASCFPVPRNAHLTVYGDVVTINGKILAPGRKIRIIARLLGVDTTPDTAPAEINVDGMLGAAPDGALLSPYKKPDAGVPGTNGYSRFTTDTPGGTGKTGEPGKPGKEGNKGQPGGTIEIYCGEIEKGSQLTLSAAGGRGGKGQTGMAGGPGGDGGIGADAAEGFLGWYKNATEGGRGGTGGTGGPGGPGGPGGAGGHIKVVALKGPLEGIQLGDFKKCVQRGDGGEKGDGGAPGPEGNPGLGGQEYDYIQGHRDSKPLPVFQGRRAKAGGSALPATASQKGGEGKKGLDTGKAEAIRPPLDPSGKPDYVELAKQIPLSQLRMMFHKARMAFLAAGEPSRLTGEFTNPDEFSRAMVLLEWLDGVLAAQVAQSKTDQKASLLLQKVSALLAKPKVNKNYFDRDWSWVPRQSLEVYTGWLEQSLASLDKIEKDRNQYYAKAHDKTEARKLLSNCVRTADHEYALYKEDLKEINQKISSSVDAITSVSKSITTAKEAAQKAIEHYKEEINKTFQLPEPMQLLGILETLSFTAAEGAQPQRAAMFASQGGKLLSSVITSFGQIETPAGAFKKEYVVHQLDVFGEDIKSLADGYKVAADRSVKLNDPNAYKLVMKRDELFRQLNTFYTADRVKADNAVRTAMDEFVELVTTQNDMILEYNALLRRNQELKTRLKALEIERREYDTQLAQNADPGLPLMSTYVDNLYEDSKERCLDDLYKTTCFGL